MVGVSTYKSAGVSRLTYAEKDAMDVAAEMKSKGWTVSLMTSRTSDARLRPDSPKDIEDRLSEYASATQENDVLLFYYSGHGFIDDQQRGYLCPINVEPSSSEALASSALSLDRVRAVLSSGKTRKKLLILDACRNVPEAKGLFGAGYTRDQLAAAEGLGVLYATAPGKRSWEPRTGLRDERGARIENGLFTHFLLRGLRGEARLNEDEFATFHEIAYWVAEEFDRFLLRDDAVDYREQRPFKDWVGGAADDILLCEIGPPASPDSRVEHDRVEIAREREDSEPVAEGNDSGVGGESHSNRNTRKFAAKAVVIPGTDGAVAALFQPWSTGFAALFARCAAKNGDTYLWFTTSRDGSDWQTPRNLDPSALVGNLLAFATAGDRAAFAFGPTKSAAVRIGYFEKDGAIKYLDGLPKLRPTLPEMHLGFLGDGRLRLVIAVKATIEIFTIDPNMPSESWVRTTIPLESMANITQIAFAKTKDSIVAAALVNAGVHVVRCSEPFEQVALNADGIRKVRPAVAVTPQGAVAVAYGQEGPTGRFAYVRRGTLEPLAFGDPIAVTPDGTQIDDKRTDILSLCLAEGELQLAQRILAAGIRELIVASLRDGVSKPSYTRGAERSDGATRTIFSKSILELAIASTDANESAVVGFISGDGGSGMEMFCRRFDPARRCFGALREIDFGASGWTFVRDFRVVTSGAVIGAGLRWHGYGQGEPVDRHDLRFVVLPSE